MSEERGKIYKVPVGENFILQFFRTGAIFPPTECMDGLHEPKRVVRIDLEPWSRQLIFYIETSEEITEEEELEKLPEKNVSYRVWGSLARPKELHRDEPTATD